jgi:hypothetical protein
MALAPHEAFRPSPEALAAAAALESALDEALLEGYKCMTPFMFWGRPGEATPTREMMAIIQARYRQQGWNSVRLVAFGSIWHIVVSADASELIREREKAPE